MQGIPWTWNPEMKMSMMTITSQQYENSQILTKLTRVCNGKAVKNIFWKEFRVKTNMRMRWKTELIWEWDGKLNSYENSSQTYGQTWNWKSVKKTLKNWYENEMEKDSYENEMNNWWNENEMGKDSCANETKGSKWDLIWTISAIWNAQEVHNRGASTTLGGACL